MEEFDDLIDILSDESLFSEFETDEGLFSKDRYSGTVRAKTSSSARKRFGGDFSKYRDLFKRVQSEIATGIRNIRPISEVEISQKSPIKQGNFYIDNGVMLYVNRIYDPTNPELKILESTNRKHKVHTIYENGTENNIWLLSLISSLYDKTRNGRIVEENISEVKILGETYVTTGYIYVVQYAGNDLRFKEMKNLYKIGFADNVDSRLSSTENQSTYLYAPVHLVAQYQIQNVDARKIEKALHHHFSENNVQLSIDSPNGKEVKVLEWFVISKDEIEERINQIIVDIQK